MDLRKAYGTDKESEVEGIWEEFSDGIKVKVARWNNPKYRDMFNAAIAKTPRKFRNKKTSDPVYKELQIKCAAKHVLKDWKGIDWDGEKDVPYSSELAEEIFTELPDFYDEVVGIAADIDNYREEEKEEDLKN